MTGEKRGARKGTRAGGENLGPQRLPNTTKRTSKMRKHEKTDQIPNREGGGRLKRERKDVACGAAHKGLKKDRGIFRGLCVSIFLASFLHPLPFHSPLETLAG